MPNTAEFKDWLFVKVPENVISYGLGIWAMYSGLPYLAYSVPGGFKDTRVELPPGSWQIIGKGDAIDWDGIVGSGLRFEAGRIVKGESNTWPNYLYQYSSGPEGDCRTATESGYSLLRSLEMEPGTVLVLKKTVTP